MVNRWNGVVCSKLVSMILEIVYVEGVVVGSCWY